jgi:integrase
MRLTQANVATLTLPEGKAEAIIFDDDLPGFGLRMRSSGARTWIFQFKIGSQHRRITLGNATALAVTVARKTAAELHAMVRLGRDPAGEKIEGRARAAETMGAVVQTYLAQARMRIKPRSYVEVARHLTVYAKPLLGLPLLGINRRTIAARLATVAASNGLVSANRMRTSLSAFFSWCMSQGLLESNPAFGTGRQPEKSRDRVLGSDELEAIWNATAGDDDYPAIVRLLMLTGARANEIGSLAWSEVLEDRIMLPAARAKNGRAHTIPLPRLARAILHARPRRDDDFVFGARKGRPFSGWSTRWRSISASRRRSVRGFSTISDARWQRGWLRPAPLRTLSKRCSTTLAVTRPGSPEFTIARAMNRRSARRWSGGAITSRR